MLKLLKGLTRQNFVSEEIIIFEPLPIHSKYAIRDFREVTMLNAEKIKKIKKRYYIFLVFYLLFGAVFYFLFDGFDGVFGPDFRQKHKIIIFVINFLCSSLPIVLALILNTYIDKKTKNIEK